MPNSHGLYYEAQQGRITRAVTSLTYGLRRGTRASNDPLEGRITPTPTGEYSASQADLNAIYEQEMYERQWQGTDPLFQPAYAPSISVEEAPIGLTPDIRHAPNPIRRFLAE